MRSSSAPRNSRPRRTFVFGRIARRHDVGDHARATDGGGELSGFVEFGERCFEGVVIFAELDGKIDDCGFDLQFREQVFSGGGACLHGWGEHDIGTWKASLGRQSGKVRPMDASLQKHTVQGEEHVVFGSESARERCGGEELRDGTSS